MYTETRLKYHRSTHGHPSLVTGPVFNYCMFTVALSSLSVRRGPFCLETIGFKIRSPIKIIYVCLSTLYLFSPLKVTVRIQLIRDEKNSYKIPELVIMILIKILKMARVLVCEVGTVKVNKQHFN